MPGGDGGVPLKERQALIRKIEKLRDGRKLVAIFNLDRTADQAHLPGLSTQFQEDLKEPLFRVLKESVGREDRLDIFLYTRGGATKCRLADSWSTEGIRREIRSVNSVQVAQQRHDARVSSEQDCNDTTGGTESD